MGSEPETLGTVTAPSGVLVIGDMGYLSMWSDDEPPRSPEPDHADFQARAHDWQITGPDADEAARRLNRQALTYLYDMPDESRLHEDWREAMADSGLDAELVREGRRIAPRERAERAAAAGGAGFLLHGVPFVALPVEGPGPFDVVGHRSASDPHAWRAVEIVLARDRSAAGTRRVDWVGVDFARLIAADLDALSAWVHDESLDGNADVAFWGGDIDKAAKKFKAPPLDDGGGNPIHGWEDLPGSDALELATKVEKWATGGRRRRRLAVDFRPHSHHYRVMRQVRHSPTESGELEVADARVLGFMTTWGDGGFDVELDVDESGRHVAARIAFES